MRNAALVILHKRGQLLCFDVLKHEITQVLEGLGVPKAEGVMKLNRTRIVYTDFVFVEECAQFCDRVCCPVCGFVSSR